MCPGNTLGQLWGSGEAPRVLVWYLEVLLRQCRDRFISGFDQSTKGGGVWGAPCPVLLWGWCWEVAHPPGGSHGVHPSPLLWGRWTTLLSLTPYQGRGATDQSLLCAPSDPPQGRGSCRQSSGRPEKLRLLAAPMHVSTCEGVCACMWG